MTGKRRGRPPIGDTALGRRTVYLTADELALATKAGDGNLSHGIRVLLRELAEYRQWHHDRHDAAQLAATSPRTNKQR
jgi:hypothetical protein